jgi:hypothetical protein
MKAAAFARRTPPAARKDLPHPTRLSARHLQLRGRRMFRIEPVDDCYRIAGYADGSDWLMPPGRHRAQSHGLVAADHVWFYDDNAELHIFNATARRRVATLAIARSISSAIAARSA